MPPAPHQIIPPLTGLMFVHLVFYNDVAPTALLIEATRSA